MAHRGMADDVIAYWGAPFTHVILIEQSDVCSEELRKRFFNRVHKTASGTSPSLNDTTYTRRIMSSSANIAFTSSSSPGPA